MFWIFFAVVSLITNSVASLLQRVLMKNDKSNALAYSSVFQLLGGLLILAVALINGFVMPPVLNHPLNFVLMVLLYTGSTFFLFKALQTTEASIATIFGSTSSLWTILIAILFLKESFGPSQFAGIVLIFTAVVLVMFNRRVFQVDQSKIYLIAYGACTGIGIANDAFILRHSEVFSYTAFTWLFPAIFRLLLRPSSIHHMKPLLKPQYLTKMLLLVCFATLSSVTFYLAYSSGGPISILSPLLSSAIVLTVILATLFLGERNDLIRKFIAAFIATAGILLIS